MPAASDHPVFLHIHLMSVHEGGVLLEGHDASHREDAGRRQPVLRPALSRSVYDAGVRQADMIVEGIFDRLDRLATADPILVIRLRGRLDAYLRGEDAPARRPGGSGSPATR